MLLRLLRLRLRLMRGEGKKRAVQSLGRSLGRGRELVGLKVGREELVGLEVGREESVGLEVPACPDTLRARSRA